MSDWDDELTGNQTRNRIEALESQLAAVKAEITRLSGKTGFCMQCEAYAKERDHYKAALEKIVSDWDEPGYKSECQECGGTVTARAALESGETK